MVSDSAGEFSGVVVVEPQRGRPGHPGSPPPLTLAVFTTGLAAVAVGVTGITKLVLAPAARPVGIVQLTTWPAAVQPAGKVPIVKPVGIVSVTVAAAVVAAVPVFCTASVYVAGVPTTKLAVLAVLVIVNAGALIVVVTEGLQRAGKGLVAAAQPGSPPPRTVAVLVTLDPAAAVGVTGITKLAVPPLAASPAATVQVTT